MKKVQNLSYIILSFIAGSFLSIATTVALAHGGDVAQIHACVKNSSASVRIVGANDTCNGNETALDWNIQGVPGPTGLPGPTGVPGQNASGSASADLPLMCTLQELTPLASRFKGKDISSAQLNKCSFDGVDLTGVIFKDAHFSSSGITNSNLTNADFSSLHMEQGGFNDSNLQNVNFSGANLESVKFTGAQNMTSANITGVTWSNVTCPDGTNSEDNGSTCAGHLTP